jgi:hypothetical protein
MERIPARPAQFQWGTGPKESNISAAIKRVRKVEGR